MNLKGVGDQRLLDETKKLVGREREVLTQILHHLREIDQRRLYCALKCQSIFDYAVRELKYSEHEASKRVQAMRALAAVPEIEPDIASGELSLTNISMVQSSYIKSGKTLDRREMLGRVKNLSSREAEALLGKPKKELTLNMIGDDALREKARKVLGKYAHSRLSLEGVLHLLFDAELAPARESKKRKTGECSHCKSTFALQIDHIVPRALGGSDEPSNLRLLCRACNQRSAIRYFGVAKMSHFLGPPS